MFHIWLDDIRDPNDPRVQEQFGAEAGMVWVKTVDAAISRLKSNRVAWISLDHDLGTSGTGYDVARWIEQRAESGELRRLVWTIHSANVDGARKLRRALEAADRHWAAQDAGDDDQ
ncbi:MAG: cyclic-phosphate processing receiver domain-containing protein [Planctomycetaceae bacterium]